MVGGLSRVSRKLGRDGRLHQDLGGRQLLHLPQGVPAAPDLLRRAANSSSSRSFWGNEILEQKWAFVGEFFSFTENPFAFSCFV